MHKSEHYFLSDKTTRHNDVPFPGQPFLIQNYSYKIIINPNGKFWRFGIRLSKTKDIEFVKEGDRHLQGDSRQYKDIHLGVGDMLNDNWINENHLYVTVYNFDEHVIVNNPIYGEATYISNTPVKFSFEYNSEKSLLSINTDAPSCSSWGTSIPLDSEYRFFQFFAWADFIPFDLHTEIEIESLNKPESAEETLLPFTVGNITFRAGNMFDSYAEENSNFVLLPASSSGTTTDTVLSHAIMLGLNRPGPNPAGSIITYPVHSSSKYKRAGYVYSLDGRKSNFEIINKLCRAILLSVKDQAVADKIEYRLSLPLLGTGAGNLDYLHVASIYNNVFNASGENLKHLVSISQKEIFTKIKRSFLGRYIGLQHENLQKPVLILELEKLLNTVIDHSAYFENVKGEITSLALNHLNLSSLSFLQPFEKLQGLNFLGCRLNDLELLSKLRQLSSLTFIACSISETTVFDKLKKLTYLNITATSIGTFDFIPKLNSLTTLILSGIGLTNLKIFQTLNNLNYLDVSDNKISDLTPLQSLTKLERLILSNNHVPYIDSLIGLKNLYYLDVSHNRISNFSGVELMNSLRVLKAESNPFFKNNNLSLPSVENQLPFIRNILIRKNETNLKEIKFPVKILLLGNHQAGKSSLLHYIQDGNLDITHGSTHIIKIEKYPKNEVGLPKAIFFDFGGQDYYHGIYRAFMTSGSVYLVLWNKEFNHNRSRKGEGDYITQDFSLNYWMAQKHFFEEEIERVQEKDPIFVIQTRADKDNYESYKQTEIHHKIENEFFISLAKGSLPPATSKDHVNEKGLIYLKEAILEIIDRKQTTRLEPQWYIDFLEYIATQSSKGTHEGLSISTTVLNNYNTSTHNAEDDLKTELQRLHYEGLVLYYDMEELEDTVWLNPAALAQYIHDHVLDKRFKTELGGRVPIEEFSKVSPKLIKLLCLQKVIYEHKYGKNNSIEYIIPNFLPLVSEDPHFNLLSFDLDKPDFILKFEYFLPFGLINQFTCFYGGLEYQKEFWRDRLIFSFKDRGRVQIHIDFEKLEIRVAITFSNGVSDREATDIKRYIYYTIMTLYWGSHKPLIYESFSKFYASGFAVDETLSDTERELFGYCKDIFAKDDCWPHDMFISTDSKQFVSYRDLCSLKNRRMINAFEIDENGKLTNKSKAIRSSSFKPFTNRDLDAPKKVAISYSTQDVDFLNEFQTHLSALTQAGLIEDPFYCLKLEAGIEWHDGIQKEFDEVDVMFFLVSHHLMSNKYVLEYEIKKSIERRKIDPTFRIIPIILVPCHWERSKTPQYDLSVFTALPFKAQPVTTFPTENDAWFCTIEYIRIWLEKDINPEDDEITLSTYTKRVQEKLLAHRQIKNS